MFRLDVFNNSFEYVSAVMIDDHQSIDLDYLTYSPYTVRCKEIEAQKGFFTHITDEDNNTIADGIIADIKPEQKTQTITIRPLNALFDAAVFYTPVSDAISWLASNIQQAFMTNSDTYQNRPINLTYTVASEQLPLTGFNLHETINILSVMISALKTYGVVVESTLDLVNKRIRVNIFRQEATKTILADLENLISSQVTIGDPFGSTNKATLRKIQVNDDESTTILGDFNFYLHPDGSIDQSNTNRIQPVFWEMETLQLEDDMTDAQWLAAATARAKEILEPAKFDNEIILRYQQADKLVYPLELPIGAQCEIHLKGEIYASLLTGKALEGKTVTLYFGVVRTDLTKQLSIKNRETFSFESTMKAVMSNVSTNYVDKKSGIAPKTKRVIDYYTGDTAPTDANINVIGNGGLLVFESEGGLTSNKPPKNGHIIHFPGLYRSGNWQTQIAFSDNKKYPYAFIRAKDSGEWGSWVNIWTSGNFYKATGMNDLQAFKETVLIGKQTEVSGNNSSQWAKLCHIKLKEHHQGNMIWIRILLGFGNNGTSTQVSMADLFLQQGWTGTLNGRLGGNYIYYPLSTSYQTLSIKVISTNAGTSPELEYDVWIKENGTYNAKAFIVFTDGRYIDSIIDDGTRQASEPTGTACSLQGGRIAYTTF